MLDKYACKDVLLKGLLVGFGVEKEKVVLLGQPSRFAETPWSYVRSKHIDMLYHFDKKIVTLKRTMKYF